MIIVLVVAVAVLMLCTTFWARRRAPRTTKRLREQALSNYRADVAADDESA